MIKNSVDHEEHSTTVELIAKSFEIVTGPEMGIDGEEIGWPETVVRLAVRCLAFEIDRDRAAVS